MLLATYQNRRGLVTYDLLPFSEILIAKNCKAGPVRKPKAIKVTRRGPTYLKPRSY